MSAAVKLFKTMETRDYRFLCLFPARALLVYDMSDLWINFRKRALELFNFSLSAVHFPAHLSAGCLDVVTTGLCFRGGQYDVIFVSKNMSALLIFRPPGGSPLGFRPLSGSFFTAVRLLRSLASWGACWKRVRVFS